MKIPDLVEGIFHRRDNRFRATVIVDGKEQWAHVPNSGRLGELLTRGRPIWLAPSDAPGRKTRFDLKLVEYASVLVSVDARLPNALFAEALTSGTITGFDYPLVEAEVTLGSSRLDFRLTGPRGICWVETKSVTLILGGVALFPDAPTERGRRHVQELIHVVQEGHEAALIFIVQRPDASSFSGNREADPEFVADLVQAQAAGVSIRAFNCQVSRNKIEVKAEIPVIL